MGTPNWKNRTLWTDDNLPIMRGMDSETVDLIYLDPPFNSKKNYAAPIGSEAAGAEFQDTWSLDDVKREWVEDIETDNTATWSAITAAGFTHGESSQAYLTYMAIRLLEMRRILRPEGSIFLHCDPTMSHYLKVVMDAIFGRGGFRNEIVWAYTGPGSSGMRQFNRKHDIIFWYSKGQQWTFNADDVRLKHHPKTKANYLSGLDGSGFSGAERTLPRGGKVPETWWTDIAIAARFKKQYKGYPTQKPLKLLDRIIRASTNTGDMVLDPFAGCATACVAAEQLGRQWAGIDIEPKARDLVVERLQAETDLRVLFKGGRLVSVSHLKTPPKRTDVDAPRRSKNIKELLYKRQGGRCAGPCGPGEEGRQLDIDLFEVDHVVPRSKGGTDTDENLQLLCSTCNRRKGSRTMARFVALVAS